LTGHLKKKENVTGGDVTLKGALWGGEVQTPRPSLCNMYILLNIKGKTVAEGLVGQAEGLMGNFPLNTLYGKKC